MPSVQVQCPNCARAYGIDSQLLGNRGRCRHCGTRFSLDASSIKATEGGGVAQGRSFPAKIGRFAIRSRLGSGAFGAVYRAHDPDLDREVALKVPHPGAMDDPKCVERFLREAKASARLRHPNIVPVFEIGVAGGNYYIASAYIAGRTLAEVVSAGPVAPDRAAAIVADLAEALHAAHEQGIVHRDVKPSNVMLDAEGRPLLMDFGLARWDGSAEKLTQDGAILGTPAYMAPEQAAGQSGGASSASDQYALGVTLYELLCGRVPFSGPLAIVIFNTVHTAPPLPSSIHAGVPPDLEAICRKAMAKTPADRYPSCKVLAEGLRDCLAGRSTIADEPGSTLPFLVDSEPLRGPTRSARGRPRVGMRTAVVAAGLVVAGAALFAGVARSWRGTNDPGPGPSRAIAAEGVRPALLAEYPPIRPEEIVTTGLPIYAKAVAPVLDGAIGEAEYGPPLALSFARDANPGKIIVGAVKDDDDLSAVLATAYTETDLYIAVKVRDDRLFASPADTEKNPWRNDGVTVYVDGDLTPNDWEQKDGGAGRYGNEGFLIGADVTGKQYTYSQTFGDSGWESKVARVDGGYVAEFRIPLGLIDTLDGPGFRATRAGSTIGASIVINDRDIEGPAMDNAMVALWHESGTAVWHWSGDESRWKARLRLVTPGEEAASSSPSPAPGRSVDPTPTAESLTGAGFPVPYRNPARSPIADGLIGSDEYGPPLLVTFGEGNPGRIVLGKVEGPDDLGAEVRAAYTDSDLFLAVTVRDEFLDDDAQPADMQFLNDCVDIFIDGDSTPNDFRMNAPGAKGGREGFQLISAVAGRKFTGPGDQPWGLSNADWEAVPRRFPGGYVLEFRIPLALIDTKDGPGEEPAKAGSRFGFNMAFNDNDAVNSKHQTFAVLWLDGEAAARQPGGPIFRTEAEFLAKMYLVPHGP